MRREEVAELFDRLAPTDVAKLVFVVRGGNALNVDIMYKLEPKCAVFRGRESGTNDEGRAFFVPYDEIVYAKIERMITLADLKLMYGEVPTEADADTPLGSSATTPAASPASAAASPPVQSAAVDPAAIAKQNLLERIRAARTLAGAPKPGTK